MPVRHGIAVDLQLRAATSAATDFLVEALQRVQLIMR